MQTIAVLNRKGGVGKTTTVLHLGGQWAAAGEHVLLCDLDPQASLTQGLLGPAAAEQLRPEQTVAALFAEGVEPELHALLIPTRFPRLVLLPGSAALDDYNVPRPRLAGWRQTALAESLAEVRPAFARILIDCPPTLYLAAWAALLAADGVLVPTQAEDFGAQGLRPVTRFIEEAQAANPFLRLAGYLLALVQPRLALHQLYAQQVRSLYPGQVLDTVIPAIKDIKEATSQRRPLAHHKPRSTAARVFVALADELGRRAADGTRRAA